MLRSSLRHGAVLLRPPTFVSSCACNTPYCARADDAVASTGEKLKSVSIGKVRPERRFKSTSPMQLTAASDTVAHHWQWCVVGSAPPAPRFLRMSASALHCQARGAMENRCDTPPPKRLHKLRSQTCIRASQKPAAKTAAMSADADGPEPTTHCWACRKDKPKSQFSRKMLTKYLQPLPFTVGPFQDIPILCITGT